MQGGFPDGGSLEEGPLEECSLKEDSLEGESLKEGSLKGDFLERGFLGHDSRHPPLCHERPSGVFRASCPWAHQTPSDLSYISPFSSWGIALEIFPLHDCHHRSSKFDP